MCNIQLLDIEYSSHRHVELTFLDWFYKKGVAICSYDKKIAYLTKLKTHFMKTLGLIMTVRILHRRKKILNNMVQTTASHRYFRSVHPTLN